MPVPENAPEPDFAAAAMRFYDDASALTAVERWDGAVYLCGYVQECTLKHLLFTSVDLQLEGQHFGHSSVRMEQPLLHLAASLGLRSPHALDLALRRGEVLDCHHPDRRYWPALWTKEDAERGALKPARELVEDLLVHDLLDHGRGWPQ